MRHGKRRDRSRDLGSGGARAPRAKIKDAQLCAEVRETLSLALAEDDRLEALVLLDVIPAPDATRLLVVIEVDGDVEEARALLERTSGWLRSEVAAAIHRKKAPTLTFDVRPRGSPAGA